MCKSKTKKKNLSACQDATLCTLTQMDVPSRTLLSPSQAAVSINCFSPIAPCGLSIMQGFLFPYGYQRRIKDNPN